VDVRQRLALLGRQSGAPSAAPDGISTLERLRRLAAESARRSAHRATGDGDVAACLGGTVLDEGLILLEGRLPLEHRHGSVAIGELSDAPVHVLSHANASASNGLLFLDTETTGLAGGTGTLPFLLGLARVEEGALRWRQYFLTGFRGEAALLRHAREWLEEGEQLVSYNGKSFDVPLLVTRHRLQRLHCPLEAKAHIDLLHPTRTAFASVWPDCRLQTAERNLLGFARRDDLPGWLVPGVWGELVRAGTTHDLPRVMEHNRLDLISLAALLAVLSRIHAEPGHPEADPLALARRHVCARRLAEAAEHLERRRNDLDRNGLLELARLKRRLGRGEEAVDIWQQLAREGIPEAILSLAKYHEHVAHDYQSALTASLDLCTLQPDEGAHRLRLDRIRRRLSGRRAK
jgi:uncharacterized protein YprB with RNaseH-like and TPR domain